MPEQQQSISLQFRPSLVIFVNKPGSDIHAHFGPTTLLASLDPALRPGIALLEVAAGRVVYPPSDEQEDDDTPMLPQEEQELAAAIKSALRKVQLSATIDAIEDEGYPVPDTRTQIYIVGDAGSPSLASVLRVVREVLRRKGFDSLVCYVLSCYRQRQTSLPPGRSPLAGSIAAPTFSSWAHREVANFCYCYGDTILLDGVRLVTPEDSNYIAAAAVFALLATGMTEAPIFQQETELRPHAREYDRIGTLSTSFILFPRAEVTAYCSAQLGVELVDRWVADIDACALSDEARVAQQRAARQDIGRLETWLKDDRTRPGFPDGKWPDLSFLKQRGNAQPERVELEQRRYYNRLVDQSRTLFNLFSFEEITGDELVIDARGSRKRRRDWTKIADKRADKAVEAFAVWDRAAKLAWEAAGTRVCTEIKYKVDRTWPLDPNGLDLAKVYVDEYWEALNSLLDRVALIRESHEREYEEALLAFEEMSAGEWLIDEQASNIIGSATGAQATPTMLRGAAIDTSEPPAPGTPPSQAAPSHIPEREDRIARQLGQRIAYMQRRVPAPPSLVGLGVLFTTVLLLFCLSLLPTAMTENWQGGAPIAALIVVGAILLNWSAYLRRKQDLRRAQEDLLNLYRRYYAHRCEMREDTLRLLVTGPLQRRVLDMRERLDDMRNFILRARQELGRDMQRASDALFNGPSASRNIFIGNGERLQRRGKNTLKEFAEQVAAQRQREPHALWHRTLEEMKAELLRSFQRNPAGLINMNEQESWQHISSFARGIVEQYLKGSLVDINTALDNADIWQSVFGRARRAIYTAQVGMRDPQIWFICGRDQDTEKGRKFFPHEAITVQTRSAEWLIVAAFFRGGTATTMGIEHLFPFTAEYLAGIPDQDDKDLDAAGVALEEDDENLNTVGVVLEEDAIDSTSLPPH